MKQAAALFLSLIMFVGGLMPQNDVEELSKLPQLFQHYQYHSSAAGGSLSLGQFLSLHYGAGQAAYNCAPAPEHEKLPFHGQHRSPNLEYVVPTIQQVVHLRKPQWLAPAYRPVAALPYSYAFAAGLLQPPRA
ncbi:hypothetical protein [Hymenobacter sp. B1770]|uniref:hypothetical protein n=1 Tax=Hymenobacter sp. B1770 TaxID=1718788 RepID=UPI003CF2A33F